MLWTSMGWRKRRKIPPYFLPGCFSPIQLGKQKLGSGCQILSNTSTVAVMSKWDTAARHNFCNLTLKRSKCQNQSARICKNLIALLEISWVMPCYHQHSSNFASMQYIFHLIEERQFHCTIFLSLWKFLKWESIGSSTCKEFSWVL